MRLENLLVANDAYFRAGTHLYNQMHPVVNSHVSKKEL